MGLFDSTTTTNNAPWKAAQPFLKYGMAQAKQLYKNQRGFNPYTGDRVANMDPATQQAYAGIMGTAAGDTSGQQAMGVNNAIMSGAITLDPSQFQRLYDAVPGQVAGQVARYDALGNELAGTQGGLRSRYETMLGQTGNPYFQNVIDQQAGDLSGDISNQFSMGGRYGGAAHTGAIAQQVGDFRNKMASENWYNNINAQRSVLGDLSGMEQGFYGQRGGLAGQAGAAEQWGAGARRGLAGDITGVNQQNIANRQAAIGAVPGIQDAMYDPYGRMAAVGSANQAQQQSEIDARMARYNEAQMSPWQRLQAMMQGGMGAASQGGTSTTTQQANPWAMLLGTGLTAASMAWPGVGAGAQMF